MYFEDKGHVYEEPTEMKWLAKPYNKKKKNNYFMIFAILKIWLFSKTQN